MRRFPWFSGVFFGIAASDEMLADARCVFHSIASNSVEAGTPKRSAVAFERLALTYILWHPM
jgi:hypothetical protein